ncbi:MAG TPA: hypothetical protein VKI19_09420 [Acidimicrobiales bacterium]|nr:hypothetical protein [Acidimicrobiales bacterium]
MLDDGHGVAFLVIAVGAGHADGQVRLLGVALHFEPPAGRRRRSRPPHRRRGGGRWCH